MALYRADGVRITHDPNAPGMADKYGDPGETDPEGFDPYADTVGPGIYGGSVVRNEEGEVVIGTQYQNHNPNPGPVYDGTGYSLMASAIHKGPTAVAAVLEEEGGGDPNEISTGGARPLHVCGMSKRGQDSVTILIGAGAEVDARDTYGFTPLHRMASNNLARGAKDLIENGADVSAVTGSGNTPLQVALHSHAWDVVSLLQE